jgi:hypothetical protein
MSEGFAEMSASLFIQLVEKNLFNEYVYGTAPADL